MGEKQADETANEELVGDRKLAGGGESAGGAYPNAAPDKGRFDGGQSDKGYRGTGDEEEGGENPNAPTQDR